MKKNTDIARRITQLRIAKFGDATGAQGEAANWLGVKPRTYSGHENQNETSARPAGVEPLILYAKKYNVSLDWLITGKGRGPKDSSDPVAKIYAALENIDRIPRVAQELIAIYVERAIEEALKDTDAKPNS